MSGALPKGWTQCNVGEVFAMFGGGTPNKGTPAYWGEGIPWLSSGDIKTSQISSASESITVEGLKNSSARLCRRGSVIVVVRSGILKHTLPIGVLETEAAINQDIKCFDSGNTELNAWLALAFRASENEILRNNREGTTVQSVKSETLASFVLPVPSIDEQRRIHLKLEHVLGKVSGCNVRLSRIPTILKRFRQSVLAAACSGRLTADWRAAINLDEDVQQYCSELNQIRRATWEKKGKKSKYVEPTLPSLADVPEIPNSWQWISADAMCHQITDGEHIQPPYQSEGYPMLSAKHVRDGYVTLEGAGLIAEDAFNTSIKRCEPVNGDILVVSVGATTGRAAIVENAPPFALVRSVLLLKPITGPRYILRWMQSHWCFQWMTLASGASAQPHLYIRDIKRMPIPLPPRAEQQEIVRRVESLFTLADQLEARYKKGKAYVDKLTQSILAKAFRGELVPQDPNDEPAEKLLERIRAYGKMNKKTLDDQHTLSLH